MEQVNNEGYPTPNAKSDTSKRDPEEELTTEDMYVILAKIQEIALIMTLKERHKHTVGFGECVLTHVKDEDIIKYSDHIDLKDVEAYVKEKSQTKRRKASSSVSSGWCHF
jgi:hypothetical protein